jgi:hypothetical protein
MKRKWRILLNYSGEVHEFFRYSKSEEGALNLGVRALEKKLNRVAGSLTIYFKKDVANREVTEIK